MTGILIIFACLVTAPMQCKSIPTGVSVSSSFACFMAAELWEEAHLEDGWFVKRWTCEDGLLDEDEG